MFAFWRGDRMRFIVGQLSDRLWVKPLAVCLLSLAAAFLAKFADGTQLADLTPEIDVDAVETLLSTLTASMLVIATFSVGSMVSAYASASNTATPRSFSVVVADDVSQNALSTFVGAFIFSVVSLTAIKNDYYETAGLFVLFILTAIVFAMVILTFVRWVDRIARLGRLGSTIEKVERATARALRRTQRQRQRTPTLSGNALESALTGQAVNAKRIGYLQHIDLAALQEWAEKHQRRLVVAVLPGAFIGPERALLYIKNDDEQPVDYGENGPDACFKIGFNRLFDEDPRFGFVVLAQIAARALSPAVNDPGTAIDIMGSMVRLFAAWSEPEKAPEPAKNPYDRVEVPEIPVGKAFRDAFSSISRDGAGMVEVMVRLQKALESMSTLDDSAVQAAARKASQDAFKRAKAALSHEEDLTAVVAASRWSAD